MSAAPAPNKGNDPAHLVCGFLGCDARPFNPLLAAFSRAFKKVVGTPPSQWRKQREVLARA